MEAITPGTYKEICSSLSLLTPKSRILGGGTDYIIRLNMGTAEPDCLCYLGKIEELKAIEPEETGISIGAYATMTELENHPVIRSRFPALSDAASDVGSLQIRNRATIGGNIGNASPAGDLIPVLYLYDASLDIMGPEGIRTIPVSQVIERPGKTTLAYNEVIVKIHMPYPVFDSAFVKLGTRKKVTISRIGIALGLEMDEDKVKDSRIWIGAISTRPVALKPAEEYLIGKPVNEYHIMQVAEELSRYIMANTPKEFDRDYKVYASRGIVSDVFETLLRRERHTVCEK